jgi:hypothetical protein
VSFLGQPLWTAAARSLQRSEQGILLNPRSPHSRSYCRYGRMQTKEMTINILFYFTPLYVMEVQSASLHSEALAHRKAVTVTHDVTPSLPPYLLLLRCSYHLKSPSPPTLAVAPLLSSPPHPLSLISSSVTISSDWYATCHRTCLGFPRAGFTGICRLKSSTYPVLDSSYDCNLLARDQH